MNVAGLEVDRNRLGRVCRHFGIQRLYVFGSFARGEAGPNSDVDLFIEYKPRPTKDSFRLGLLRPAFEDLVGRQVDILTSYAFKSEFLKEEIRSNRVLLYEARKP